MSMPLFLRERDVKRLLTMDDALAAVEEAFRLQGLGKADNCPRQRPRVGRTMLQVMSAAIAGMGFGLKAYTVASGGVRFVVLLWDGATGDLAAVIEAGFMGQMRTGAASGVATKVLARADAATVGLFGTGTQAPAQLEAVCAVRPIEHVWVYSRTPERRERFAAAMSERLGVRPPGVGPPGVAVEAASAPRDVVAQADVVVTITTASEPLFDGNWLRPGVHVNAAGSNRPHAREIDARTVERADLITIDDRAQGRIEAGDLIAAGRQGVLAWEDVVELGQVVAGTAEGRQDDHSITLFESLGVAIEDVALARRVCEKAVALGVGEKLPETILG
jgi:ornithine cyclodeaminase/alanine dehydrogenase-like protein (mu-crystallin family)